jgi:hypothetical protein
MSADERGTEHAAQALNLILNHAAASHAARAGLSGPSGAAVNRAASILSREPVPVRAGPP